MKLNLDDGTMRELVSKAIFDKMTPESREEMITGAIGNLIKERDPHMGRGQKMPSLLHQAFDRAVADLAQKMLVEQLAEDSSFKAKVGAAITRGVDALVETKAEAIADQFATALVKALGRDY